MISPEEDNMTRNTENCSIIEKQFVLNLNNNTDFDAPIVFNILFNAILALTATLGNGMIIVAILKSQNLRTPSYLLITSLAFVDLLVGLVFHPLQIVLNTYNLQNNIQGICRVAKSYAFLTVYSGFISLCMAACIGIDRYLALTLRHRYTIIVTKKRVRLLIVLVWIVMVPMAFQATIDSLVKASYTIGSFTGFVLLSITCVCYIKSFRALHLYTVQVHAQQPNPLAGNFDVVRYKKTLKTMLLVLVCHLFCCLPLGYALVTMTVLGYQAKVSVFYFMSITIASFHSSINPVIYVLRFKDIGDACRQTLYNLIH